MANKLTRYFNRKATPQSMPIPGSTQVPNSAGGFAWEVDQWQRLARFLILGTEGGTYYISEQTLTLQNADNVLKCIREDGLRVVNEVVAISDAGRAPKNTPAIFVLALATAHGDDKTRAAALAALPQVCRIGTHLFQFAEMVQTFRGWGRGLRRGVGAWYTDKQPRDLAYQLVKYRQREGWTHRDLLRLAHPRPNEASMDALFKWVTKPEDAAWAAADAQPEDAALAYVWAFERAQKAQTVAEVVKLITDYDLPREALPTQFLNEREVWEALLVKMPMTAMIRNLGVMSKIGLLTALSDAERTVIARLNDEERLRKARIHPIAVLSALRVYGGGRGQRSDGTWTPTAGVKDALEKAFYKTFKNVQPANKRFMLALDVSGSMSVGVIAGVPGLTPRDASGVMAMVTARTEPHYTVMAFADKFVPLDVTARLSLDEVMQRISNLPMMGTDCALPMLYAMEKKIAVDTFVVYTDSETWANPKVHPSQALVQYREKMGIDARLVVVGLVSNGFTIADPKDRGMLDVVGFDAAAPGVISDFAKGAIG